MTRGYKIIIAILIVALIYYFWTSRSTPAPEPMTGSSSGISQVIRLLRADPEKAVLLAQLLQAFEIQDGKLKTTIPLQVQDTFVMGNHPEDPTSGIMAHPTHLHDGQVAFVMGGDGDLVFNTAGDGKIYLRHNMNPETQNMIGEQFIQVGPAYLGAQPEQNENDQSGTITYDPKIAIFSHRDRLHLTTKSFASYQNGFSVVNCAGTDGQIVFKHFDDIASEVKVFPYYMTVGGAYMGASVVDQDNQQMHDPSVAMFTHQDRRHLHNRALVADGTGFTILNDFVDPNEQNNNNGGPQLGPGGKLILQGNGQPIINAENIKGNFDQITKQNVIDQANQMAQQALQIAQQQGQQNQGGGGGVGLAQNVWNHTPAGMATNLFGGGGGLPGGL